jgi:DNA-binding LytR/AlgR family response regulator
MRVNRQCIVQLAHIDTINLESSLIVIQGTEIPFSWSTRKELKAVMNLII